MSNSPAVLNAAPEVVGITATLRCACGEEHEFDGIEDGWQYIWPCDCGRRISIQIGDPIAQYDRAGVGMIPAEATVVETWTGIDPGAGKEYLVRKYTDRSRTVATRPAWSGDAWGPEVSLRTKDADADPGRCTCGFASCSDAGWRR